MELMKYSNKGEELMANGRNLARETVIKIKTGEVIKDFIDDNGERIIVTLTDRGTYGYQVFLNDEEMPHYYVEGMYLIKDLNKKTDSLGKPLKYESAKSRIQRNMLGCFTEYILDRGYHSFYINHKSMPNGEIEVTQRMTGYDEGDPVVLAGWHFDTYEFSIVADAQMINLDNKSILRLGLGKVNDDGTIDYDLLHKNALEAEMAKRFLGEKTIEPERLKELMLMATKDAQATIFGLYSTLGLPIIEGVEPNNLLAEDLKPLLPESKNNNNRLN